MNIPINASSLYDRKEEVKKSRTLFFRRKGAVSTYVPIPSAPFSTGFTRVQAGLTVAGQLRESDLGNPTTGIDVLFSGNFTDGLSLNAIDAGSAAVPMRFTNSGTVVIGTNTKGLATIGLNDYCEFYGASPASPLIINAAGSGQNGMNWIAQTGGTSLKMQNIVFKNIASSSVQNNSSSGDYRDMELSFLRSVGDLREFLYLGNTGTTFSVFNSIDIQHCYGANMAWDPIQIGHCTDLYLAKCTFYNGGTDNTGSQNHLVQIVDTNGLIEDVIFDSAPRICNLSCHGVTFRNCVFIYSSATERGFIGRTDNLSYYPTARHNGEPILFDNCKFIAKTGAITTQIVAIQERIANVEFRDCQFSNGTVSGTAAIASLTLDQRVAGFSNQIIGTISTNGNSTAALPLPTYTNHNIEDYQNHGLLTSAFYKNLGMGYRTI